MGPDAVVISNKAVENGVEIVAMSPESLDAISQEVRPASKSSSPPPPARPIPPTTDDDYTVTLSSARREPPRVRPWLPYDNAVPVPAAAESPRLRPLPPHQPADDILSPQQVATSLRQAASESPSTQKADPVPEVAQLRDEMRVIKNLLERQLAGFAWGEMARETPARALLLGEMLTAGFSGSLARRLVQDMPADLNRDDGRKWLTAAVNRRLRTLSSEADFIDRGGVYALVGPTGVGKTTTTAKLAARCVVRYGAERLALLTTDGYRIGAQEQLRIYGRILGVPVFVVRDGEDLRRTLADLRDKHMVLIDTVGMSQRDRMVAEQAAMLTRSGEVNRLLLLNAGSRGDTLDDVVRAYAGEDLAGCILTKVDEATALAPALDCIVRHGLTLSYVANGQRVPEDLHLPNRNYLLHRAFKVGAGETAHTLRKEEIALAFTQNQDAALGASLA
jgi:flagellar biosynthesis protein FlhF